MISALQGRPHKGGLVEGYLNDAKAKLAHG